MEPKHDIKIYGSENCHKSIFYKEYFKGRNIPCDFLDVLRDEACAEALRGLYSNRKLNFPTITIKDKKLRNPKVEDIEKWLRNKGVVGASDTVL
tara:strand:- start:977 stop:1258 length:282 start_codon:yes stop_codon:yes gene_type:complete